MNNCERRDCDISQMILSTQYGSMVVRFSEFEHEKFRELLIAAIVMHNLLLSFLEYYGIRALLLFV